VFGDVDFRAIETGPIERAECGIPDGTILRAVEMTGGSN
jgi:hypothetical protein